MMKATVFGDSILKGVLLTDGKYTVNHEWEDLLTSRFDLSVQNRSRFGCTIRKALPIICRNCMEDTDPEEYVLLEFGGNDCDYPWEQIAEEPCGSYSCKTPPEDFQALYREAVRHVRASGRRPVISTLPPIHSERYLRFICRNGLNRMNILRWLGDLEAISRWQGYYSVLTKEIAEEEGVKLIDVRKEFPGDPDDLAGYVCEDGIHPSRAGQKLIYQAFCEAIA